MLLSFKCNYVTLVNEIYISLIVRQLKYFILQLSTVRIGELEQMPVFEMAEPNYDSGFDTGLLPRFTNFMLLE